MLGIILIILGLIFIICPLYSAAAVSWIAGICLIVFGFASIIDGFSVWSMMAHVSVINILLGICAILFGLLFIYEIDVLSFLVGFLFYLIAFVMIFIGISGIIFGVGSISKITSVLILILGIIACGLAFYSLAQPLYTSILVGLCLILEGIAFLTTGAVED